MVLLPLLLIAFGFVAAFSLLGYVPIEAGVFLFAFTWLYWLARWGDRAIRRLVAASMAVLGLLGVAAMAMDNFTRFWF